MYVGEVGLGAPLRFEASAILASHMGFRGFKTPLNCVQNFLSYCVFFWGGYSRVPITCSEAPSYTPTPGPQNEEPWRFITVYHVMVYNAVIKDKELDPFTFALTWRD